MSTAGIPAFSLPRPARPVIVVPAAGSSAHPASAAINPPLCSTTTHAWPSAAFCSTSSTQHLLQQHLQHHLHPRPPSPPPQQHNKNFFFFPQPSQKPSSTTSITNPPIPPQILLPSPPLSSSPSPSPSFSLTTNHPPLDPLQPPSSFLFNPPSSTSPLYKDNIISSSLPHNPPPAVIPLATASTAAIASTASSAAASAAASVTSPSITAQNPTSSPLTTYHSPILHPAILPSPTPLQPSSPCLGPAPDSSPFLCATTASPTFAYPPLAPSAKRLLAFVKPPKPSSTTTSSSSSSKSSPSASTSSQPNSSTHNIPPTPSIPPLKRFLYSSAALFSLKMDPQSASKPTTTSLSNVATPTTANESVRGKLKVRITEAHNILVLSPNPCPYVVCTFNSSEFITQAANGATYIPQPLDASSAGSAGDSSTISSTSSGIAIPSKSSSTLRQTSNLTLSGIYNKIKGGPANPTSSTTNPTSSTNINISNPTTSNNQNNNNSNTINTLNSNTSSAGPSVSSSSSNSLSPSNPTWSDEAQFDVTNETAELDISIYDANSADAFLGRVLIQTNLAKESHFDKWLPLESRFDSARVTGEVRVQMTYEPTRNKRIGPDDFEVLRLVGKGTFGQVYQVRKRDTHRIYAMKVLSKKVIVQKKEIAHTIGERDILVRTALADSNFIVGLKFSFQTPSDLYLVTDYMSGGELFWHLQKEGRFSEERAKFYIAELIIALEHLHDNDIVYRDLKPENILLDANGHIALCDFGLSKANLSDNGTTNTFCGTTEYLAPEVLLDDKGYTKMVDFWSLGVLVFEMCCGWSPFYHEDVQQMYKNIAFGKVRFPKDALSAEGRNFVKGLLNRNPKHRLGANGDARELRAHPFFADIDWSQLAAKMIPPPFKPVIVSETDTSNFDPEFTQASTSVLKRGFLPLGSTPLSPGIQANFQGFTYVDESSMDQHLAPSLSVSEMMHSGSLTGLPRMPDDGDIELYDDNDIENTVEYNSRHGLSNNKLLEEDDVGMLDDDDGFVNGQQFEM